MIKKIFTHIAISIIIIGCSKSDEGIATNEILSYQNIQLGGVDIQNATGSYFSTITGKIIKSGELNEINGPSIDIAYVGTLGVRFFESPDSVDYWNLTEIPNAQTTEFTNNMIESNLVFTVETFDNMINDTPLKDLNITSDMKSLPLSGTPIIVLFKNAYGKKGAIKITEMSDSQKDGTVTFDLKIQK